MRKILIFSFLLVIISFIISLSFYNQLPDKIASHWNAKGEADDYQSKYFVLLLMPAFSLFILMLFLVLPLIDPLRKNIKKFQKHYDMFFFILILFFLYIHIMTIAWNINDFKFNMSLAVIPAVGLMFIYIGFLLKHVKRNWFMGIRTPWTLSSENVWKKTHDLGSRLFIISGIITLAGVFFIKYLIWFILIPVIVTVTWLFIYSYLVWRKEKK